MALNAGAQELLSGFEAALEKALAPMKENYPGPAGAGAGDTAAWKTAVLDSVKGWDAQPKPGQVVEYQKDGTLKFLSASASKGKNEASAAMGLGITGGPTIGRVPVLGIAVGGLVGMTVGHLIDGLFPPTSSGSLGFSVTNVGLKVGAMVALGAWGPGSFIGTVGTTVAIGLLGIQLLSDILPFDQWIQKIVSFFKGLLGGVGLGHRGPLRQDPSPLAQERNDLYAPIFGRN